MGILAFMFGIFVILALIGFAVTYVAMMTLLAVLGGSTLIAFFIFHAMLGGNHIGLSMLLALPTGLLGLQLFIRALKGTE